MELPLTPAFARRQGMILALSPEPEAQLWCLERVTASALQEARRLAGRPMAVQVLSEADFEQRLVACYQQDAAWMQRMANELGSDIDFFTLAEELPAQDDLLESDDGAPIIRLINAMLGEAIKQGASDVHIETYEHNLSIRFRIDGMLQEILQPQRKLAALLVSRIKVMARLDIAEKRIPQDGRIALRIGGRAVDVRVSTLPASHGERVVLRLLDKSNLRLDLGGLGMADALHQQMQTLLTLPHGILLVTGPTGSGKTTTLYAALSHLNSKSRNILTVEDPIEYDLPGVGQTQVNTKVDMTFARGLRAILRQDPDVVMVGEIRDRETAEIAVQASLTGHLVLSTLHTNSAVGAVSRLQDMGIEPFLLATSLAGVIGQRLVRVLCPACRQPQQASAGDPLPEGQRFYRAGGCSQCHGTGYQGRSAIHELLVLNDNCRQAIHDGQASALSRHLFAGSLYHNALAAVAAGVTSLEEALRVTREA